MSWALTLVLGSIALVDLHLLGLVERGRDTAALIRRLLPLTWAGFAVAAITGTTLVFANPQGYFANFFFRGKLLLLLLAGLNVLVFHRFVQPRAGPVGHRVSGGISLILWLAVVSFGPLDRLYDLAGSVPGGRGLFDIDQVGLQHLAVVDQRGLAKSAAMLAIAQRVYVHRNMIPWFQRLAGPPQARQIARAGQFDRPQPRLPGRPRRHRQTTKRAD